MSSAARTGAGSANIDACVVSRPVRAIRTCATLVKTKDPPVSVSRNTRPSSVKFPDEELAAERALQREDRVDFSSTTAARDRSRWRAFSHGLPWDCLSSSALSLRCGRPRLSSKARGTPVLRSRRPTDRVEQALRSRERWSRRLAPNKKRKVARADELGHDDDGR